MAIALSLPTARVESQKEMCQLVKELTRYEMYALFYNSPTFQKTILEHAIFLHPCEECSEKLSQCHSAIEEEKFRKAIGEHLATGQRKVRAFLQVAL